jgi:diguanylate cyclase (GGDEF)-like protein
MPAERFPLRLWTLQALFAAAWVALWQWSILLAQTQHASLWFPAAGLSFAMFLTRGPWAAIPIVLAGVATTFISAARTGDPRAWSLLLASGLGFSLAHSASYWLGAWTFDRLFGNAKLGTPGSVFGFLLIVTASAFAAALGGLSVLAATGTPNSGLSVNLIAWAVGDMVGVVCLGPLLAAICDWSATRLGLPSSGWLDGLGRLGGATGSLSAFVVKLVASIGGAFALRALDAHLGLRAPVALLVYLLLVPLAWIAHTEGAFRTLGAVAALATTVATGAAMLGSNAQAFDYQAAMITIAATCLFNLTVPKLYADNRRLLELVTYDQLTGAFSRPVFLELAERELQRARRSWTPLAVIALDLDRFKAVNDTYGHGVGDRVLALTGSICRATLRSDDLFGRLGGEEFTILLPATGADDARQVAERLRTSFAEADWGAATGSAPVTASFGVAIVEPQAGTLALALERADHALYAAKAAGRNTVRFA